MRRQRKQLTHFRPRPLRSRGDQLTSRAPAAYAPSIRAVLETSSVGVCFFDTDMRVVDANPRYAEMAVFDYETMRGRSLYELNPANLVRKHMHERVLAGEAISVQNVEFLHPVTGERGYRDITYSPVRGSGGQVVGLFTTVVDVTDRVTAEQSLRESEQRFRRAVVESPLPIIIHAEDGQVLEISQGLSEITGYSRPELPTIDEWATRAYGEEAGEMSAYMSGLYSLNETAERRAEGEQAVRTADGRTRIWDFFSVPLGRLPDGRRVVMSAAADVTERYELDRRKDEFIAVASHELRTPLTVILGFSRMALKLLGVSRTPQRGARRGLSRSWRMRDQIEEEVGPGGAGGTELDGAVYEKLVKWLLQIGEAAERVGRLVEDLLTVSRITEQTPDATPDREAFDLRSLCDDLLAGVRLQHPNTEILYRSLPNALPVLADRHGIERVLLNLIDNAAKYGTGPGARQRRGRVEIATRSDGDRATVSVKDWGPGISAEIQPHIFDRFYRGPASGTRSRSGLGLGLYIARRIAQENGGEISFTTRRGAGTTFVLTLPLHLPAAPDDTLSR